ncbi:response regulator [Neobacillus cucumis]|uniref:DNA-binding response regulator n=1 Tax=Neobacillus cucumis TaxID=1740721 RepID=A0A2N5H6F9_9BACI|nr:response regulator [Neobacillus cucumis]PLS01088.1 DNA-binding response regulator [Neobacillus cucumis]
MNKVILVDDENFFRKGLRSLIDWRACGFEVAGEAANGEDALALIDEVNPELVITDIRMPVLDGLELIKQVTEKAGNHPKFIIISGYSDFKYAQQAVRYGVHDFILKPIDQEEIEETLRSLSNTIMEQKLVVERNIEIKKAVLLDNLILGKVNEEDACVFSKELLLSSAAEYYYLILEVNGLPESPTESAPDYQVKEKITKIIRNICDPHVGVFIQDLEQGSYGLLIPSTYLHRFQMQIGHFVNWINGLLTSNMTQAVTFYIGPAVPKLHLLKDSFEAAKNAREYKYFYEDKNIILSIDIENNKAITYTELEDSYYHQLIEQIEENTTLAIMETIDKIFLEFVSKKMARVAVKATINRFVHAILKIIKNMEGEVSNLKNFQTMLQLQNYNLTLQQLRKQFLEFVLESKEMITILRKQSSDGEAHKIKQFVDSHYRENMSLKSIAAKFYMNPVYLGQLFKKTYGIYFKDYLLQVRINEAKKLLRQSELKIYEIAERVGFNNTDYFVTMFGKYEKLTPSEYRNKLLEKRKV